MVIVYSYVNLPEGNEQGLAAPKPKKIASENRTCWKLEASFIRHYNMESLSDWWFQSLWKMVVNDG